MCNPADPCERLSFGHVVSGHAVHFETVAFAGREQARDWVQARNAHRRHCTPSQLAGALVKVNTWTHGTNQHGKPKGEDASRDASSKTQERAASDNNIGRKPPCSAPPRSRRRLPS